MKKHIFEILLIVTILFILASCKTPRYAYSPSAHNVPVITQKGDGKIGALYSTNTMGGSAEGTNAINNTANGFDVQGAYALSDNWAVQASHFQRWETTTGGSDSVTIKYRRNLTEIGGGYYYALSENKKTFIQFFAGLGLGKFSFTDHSINGDFFHQSNIFKFYIQPAFLFRSKGSFSGAVDVRGSFIKFNSIKTNYTADALTNYKLDNLNGGTKFFLEPGFTGSFGFKNIPGLRIEIQGSVSIFPSDNPFNYRKSNFSIGSYLDFGSLKRRNIKP